jgi:murein DD-endopeptidase MepM/ murein hydrolase activator NlpD
MNSPYNGKFRVSQQYKGSAHDGLDLVGVDSKEVHSTVNGVVEKAGWENLLNHKQGFGKYVRIKKDGTNDRYYFGHLSEIKVKKGDKVKITDVIGIEGNTGYSFGSHCHYCARGNASKKEIKDISIISGIPNKLGTYDDGYAAKLEAQKNTKPNEEIAREVIQGKWGNGSERKEKLKNAGYNPSEIQAIVNKMLK